jgi:hypothetical protein
MNFPRHARSLAAILIAASVSACSSSPSSSGTGGKSGGNQDANNPSGSGGSQVGSGGSGGDSGTGGSGGSVTGSGGSTPATGGSSGLDGAADVGGEAGGGDTAPGACPYMFCEDFESDKAGMPPNPTRWHQDGTMTIVDTVKPHKGTQAMHVLPHVGALCTDGQPCLAARFARITDAFPQALHKTQYGRMFFYLNQMPTDTQYYHWMVMEVNASTSYSGGLALRQGGEMPAGGPVTNNVAKNYMLTHIDTHNKMDNPFETERGRVQTQTPLTNKVWYCLEWFIDAPNQKARYWLNGDQRAGLDWNGPIAGMPQFTLPAEFKSMAFGMRAFQVSTQQFELFVDDIALDSKQIGCN